jgi:hypothetical protein
MTDLRGEALQPCPFCGSPARTDEGHNEPATQFVECTNCSAGMEGPKAYMDWNARAQSAEQKMVTALRERIADFILTDSRDIADWAEELSTIQHNLDVLLESLRSATAPLPANARAVAEKCAEIAKPKSDNPETTWERGYWAAQNGIWRDILKLIDSLPKVKE